jgi:hypothetical protein
MTISPDSANTSDPDSRVVGRGFVAVVCESVS